MMKSCYGFANSAENALVVMDVMLKHSVKIVSVTDTGWSSESDLRRRFHVFGVAEDESQLEAVAKETRAMAGSMS